MRFLSNIYDPKNEFAKLCFMYSLSAIAGGTESMEEEWKRHVELVNSKITGRPRATERNSVEELERMGYIGVYGEE